MKGAVCSAKIHFQVSAVAVWAAIHLLLTPIFPLQSTYDSWQIAYDLDSTNVNAINTYGKSLEDLVKAGILIKPHNGIFLDSCEHHCGNWNSMHISGQTQATAFSDFFEGKPKKVWIQGKPYPCASCCT